MEPPNDLSKGNETKEDDSSRNPRSRLLAKPSDDHDDIDLKTLNDIRLKLVEISANTALQYAALAAAIAVVWATILSYTGAVGDYSFVWIVEGVVGAIGIHLILNAAYYGRMSGLLGGVYVDVDRELGKKPRASLIWFGRTTI